MSDSIFAPTPRPSISIATSRGLEVYKKAMIPMSIWAIVSHGTIIGINYVVGLSTAGIGLIVTLLLYSLVWFPVHAGYYHAAYDSARGRDVTFATMFKGFSDKNTYILGLLFTLCCSVTGLCCFLPIFIPISLAPWWLGGLIGRRKTGVDALKYGTNVYTKNIGTSLMVSIFGGMLYFLGDISIILSFFLVPISICLHIAAFEMLSSPRDD